MGLFDFLGTSSDSQSTNSGVRVAPETALEKQLTGSLGGNYTSMEGMVNAGGNVQDASNAAGAQRSLADMLQQYSQGGFLPNQKDISAYTDVGNQIFGGQLRQQQIESSRLAGRLGRSVNDPILQNKLAQQRSDTVGQFAAQQSLQAPMQRLQFAQQRSDVLGGLASQALSNRQALMQLGSGLREQDRGYRLNTAERYSNTTQTHTASPLDTIGGIAGIAGGIMSGGLLPAAGGMLKGLMGGGGGKGDPAAQALGQPGASNDHMAMLRNYNQASNQQGFGGYGNQGQQPQSNQQFITPNNYLQARNQYAGGQGYPGTAGAQGSYSSGIQGGGSYQAFGGYSPWGAQ